MLEMKQMLEMKHVDDDNNIGFDGKFDDCDDDDRDEEEDDGNFSDLYDDACMLMKYGDVNDQYDYFSGDF